jgi:hypothetical protein
MKLNVVLHDYKKMYCIKASEDIISTLEEHLVQLYFMKGSKYDNIIFDDYY